VCNAAFSTLTFINEDVLLCGNKRRYAMKENGNAKRAKNFLIVFVSLAIIGVAFISLQGCETDTGDIGTSEKAIRWPPEMFIPFNYIQMKTSHNSYQRYEMSRDQMGFHRVFGFEFDLWDHKSGYNWQNGDWFVYHNSSEKYDTWVLRFSDALKDLRAYHNGNPNHYPIVIYIDMKEPFQGQVGENSAEDLDMLLTGHLGSSNIYTPLDLLQRCGYWDISQIHDAVRECGWPTLWDMKGKFLVILSGWHSSCPDYADPNNVSNRYLLDLGTAGCAFTSCGIPDYSPEDINSCMDVWWKTVVFVNDEPGFNSGDYEKAHIANEEPDEYGQGGRQFLFRVWGLNDSTTWNNAVNEGVHLLGNDMVNYLADPWSRTHNSSGYPFQCRVPESTEYPRCAELSTENSFERVITTHVRSGDIYGTSDSMGNAYNIYNDDLLHEWTAEIYTESSHTADEHGKVCLMARVDYAANGRYFAICRLADNHVGTAQWRTTIGGATGEVSYPTIDDHGIKTYNFIDSDSDWDLRAESTTWLRLLTYKSGSYYYAVGYISPDGTSWKYVGYQWFSERPMRQGLAVSSHNTSETQKYVIRNLKHTYNGNTYDMYWSSFLNYKKWGSCSIFTGVDGYAD
jgi:hypothetical protein